MSLENQQIGILGLGFLGKTIAGKPEAAPESWGTVFNSELKHKLRSLPINTFHFDWSNEKTWSAIPEHPVTLVLTIPPLLKNPQEEKTRLQKWCEWMRGNRPQLQRLIYISTTGVYPGRNGFWQEDSEFEPETIAAKLRLRTEEVLAEYFRLQIVRSSAIYGDGRSVLARLKTGKEISLSSTPVHRIHVEDLAQIVLYLVEKTDAPPCVNAVDMEAKPSWEVARWLVENHDELSVDLLPKLPDSFFTIPGTPERKISNQRLLDLGITLTYPTFREGMC